jgi:hypothetical protein
MCTALAVLQGYKLMGAQRFSATQLLFQAFCELTLCASHVHAMLVFVWSAALQTEWGAGSMALMLWLDW